MAKSFRVATASAQGRISRTVEGGLLSLVLLIGCAPMDSAETEPDDTASTRQPAYASSSRIWNRISLSVCFAFPGKYDVKAWVRNAVQASYSRVSGLEFTGWLDCPSAGLATGSPTEADIKIADSTAISSYIGTDSAAHYPSMWLNFDQANWLGVVNITLHEFAHALGLYHEFDRPDHPTNPNDDRVHEDGVIFGNYDFYSASLITYNNSAGRMLSPTDVAFLRSYYGTNPSYNAGNSLWATFYFEATDTSNATGPNTHVETVALNAGDTLTVGTCGLPFALARGDTFLRLRNGSTEVATSNNTCDLVSSFLTYRAPTSGNYSIRIGCVEATSCEGILTYTIARPDLVISLINHSPQFPSPGDLITVTAVVRNAGSGPALSSNLRVQTDAPVKPVVLLSVPELQPGQSVSRSRSFLTSPAHEVTYHYSVRADVSGTVTESDEGNNAASGQVTTRFK